MTTQTILQYNGVRLQNVQTLSFTETSVNNSAGQYLYTTTSLRVVGYISKLDCQHSANPIGTWPTLYQAELPDANPGARLTPGATQQYQVLKSFLLSPRRRLVYSTLSVGTALAKNMGQNESELGHVLFDIRPAKSTVADDDSGGTEMTVRTDVKAGPVPNNVNITNISNNTMWRVEFSVEFSTIQPCIRLDGYVNLPQGDALDPGTSIEEQVRLPLPTTVESIQRERGILSNRWSCKDMINENGYTTRVYTGKVILANPHWNPQDFRDITTPPLIPGMMRMSIDYTASEDNLSLHYSITDVEVTTTAPAPSRQMKIVHTESMNHWGALCNFNIRVMLTGQRTASLKDLYDLATVIIEQRLYFNLPIPDGEASPVIVEQREATTEQGTDQVHMVVMTWNGKRVPPLNPDDAAGQKIATHAKRSLTWRPVAGDGWLTNYNNTLAVGNRNGEQPETEVSIPAISCLHAKLTTPCTTDLSTASSLSPTSETEARTTRITDTKTDIPKMPAGEEENTTAWPTAISVSIDDNIQDIPVNLNYSADHQTAPYTHYNITSSYNVNEMKVSLPIAKTYSYGYAGNLNSVVTIGQSQPTRSIRIAAERVGQPPKLPGATSVFYEIDEAGNIYGVQNTLLSAKAVHLNPAPMADQKAMLYTSYLELEYAQNQLAGKHRFGVPEYINTNPERTLTPLSHPNKYSRSLTEIFRPGVLADDTTWNV